VRELLLQNGAPLLGHRGLGSFGKGSWVACVELRFPLEPASAFPDIVATGHMVFVASASASAAAAAVAAKPGQQDAAMGGDEDGIGQRPRKRRAAPPTGAVGAAAASAGTGGTGGGGDVSDGRGWVRFLIDEPEKFESCRQREVARWEQAESKRTAAATAAAAALNAATGVKEGTAVVNSEVRRMPSWPRSWANFSSL
jgi:hypothetical protein